MRVTLKDIASATGVSFSTVAAALRGEPWVRDATRARIVQTAAEMGYRRHPAASILASRRHLGQAAARTISVAWLTATGRKQGLSAKLHRARRLARERGWIFHHHNLTSAREAAEVASEWEAQRIDGVILARTTELEIPIPFPWERFTVLSTEMNRMSEGFDVIRPTQFRAIIELLHLALARGYQRIGVWLKTHEPLQPDDESRLGALLMFRSEYLAKGQKLEILRTPFSFAAYHRKVRRWFESKSLDLVIAFHSHDFQILEEWECYRPPDQGGAALHVGWEEEGQIAGIRDRETSMADAAYLFLERNLRSGLRGLSSHPQEFIFHLEFLDGKSLPDRAG